MTEPKPAELATASDVGAITQEQITAYLMGVIQSVEKRLGSSYTAAKIEVSRHNYHGSPDRPEVICTIYVPGNGHLSAPTFEKSQLIHEQAVLPGPKAARLRADAELEMKAAQRKLDEAAKLEASSNEPA